MGEVYVAHDARLNRNVALKIISSGSGADLTRQRRFTVEARAASALNHPNIITVHDFGSSDGISYIVSELVDGESLRSVIGRGPVRIGDLMQIAVQIADGLEAAHEAGIVHRDLKPENIMITRSGRVKILDFGLAKPTLTRELANDEDSSDATFDGLNTQPGLIVGTVGYMSPEQARGEAVSFESDQFSFGLILHEMATGQPAFKRETPMQTLLAIANVDRLPFTPGPVAFRLLVERLLARDPAQRFGSTAELHERLRKILAELPLAGVQPTPVEPNPSEPAVQLAPQPLPAERFFGRRAAVALLVALLLFSSGMLAARLLSRSPSPDLSRYRLVPLTTEPGPQVLPAISHDGSWVAYSQPVDGIFQVFTQPFQGGVPVQLTKAPQDCLNAFWSLDRSRVFYLSAGSLWSVSTYGGEPHALASDVYGADVAPDGQAFAVLRGDGLARLNEGGSPQRISQSVEGAGLVRFSPDGKRVGVWQGDRLSTFSWPKGDAQIALRGPASGFAWIPDGDRVLYGDEHLWAADLGNGKRTELTSGTGSENWPSLSRDGQHAAFASGALHPELVSVGRKISLPGSGAWPAWSPVRDEFAYVSGTLEIRLRSAQSGWERTLARATSRVSELAFSPDGQRLAYVSDGAIWVVGLNGEPALRTVVGTSPAWSPDGASIAFLTGNALRRLKLGDSTAPVTVYAGSFTTVRWNPDGKGFAVIDRGGSVLLISADGTTARHVGRRSWLNLAWSKDGSLLGLRKSAQRHLEVVGMDTSSGVESVRSDLGAYPPALGFSEGVGLNPVNGSSVSSDGTSILISLPRLQSNLWTATGLS